MTFELLMRDKYKSGKAEGIAEAEAKAKEEKAQIVKNMHSMDIPLEKITKCTGLSLEDVNKIISAK